MICSGKKNNSSNIDHSVYVYMETYTQKVHKMIPKSRSQVIILDMPLTPGLLLIADGEKTWAA
jgi:hypothetical protein